MKKKNMRPDVPYILCAGRFFALSFFLGTKRRNLKGPFLLVIRSAAPARPSHASAIKFFIEQLPRRQSMNRNRKSPLEKKISKRFFYSVSRFFCVSVFFLSTNRVIFLLR